MKSTSKTEQEMRVESAPTPKTEAELIEYINSVVTRPHDYGTSVYAMSLAATAAYNYAASKLQVTGFQAGCASMDVIRRTRGYEGPFILLNGEDMLYPQYNLQQKLSEAMTEWGSWAAEQAKLKLAKKDLGNVHPNVSAHWRKLAAN